MHLYQLASLASFVLTTIALPVNDATTATLETRQAESLPGGFHMRPMGLNGDILIIDTVGDGVNGVKIAHTDQSIMCTVTNMETPIDEPCGNSKSWTYRWDSGALKMTHWVKYGDSTDTDPNLPSSPPLVRRRDAVQTAATWRDLVEANIKVCEREASSQEQELHSFDFIQATPGPAGECPN